MIYFLLDEAERLIEIGMTGQMNSRLAQRRRTYGDVLRLLAVIEGDRLEVAAIRERFSSLKAHDDWHRIDSPLVAFIGREGHPWGGGMPAGTPEYHDRLADLAAVSKIPAATLVELALSGWADRHGFSDEGAGEGESALPRIIDGSEPASRPGEPGRDLMPRGASSMNDSCLIPRLAKAQEDGEVL